MRASVDLIVDVLRAASDPGARGCPEYHLLKSQAFLAIADEAEEEGDIATAEESRRLAVIARSRANTLAGAA